MKIPSLKGKVGAEEWQQRCDLAAAYRLVAHYGWDDLIFTHLSARVPGPEHHFLINPYDMMFEEITASSLVKIDVEGQPVVPTAHPVRSPAAGARWPGAIRQSANPSARAISFRALTKFVLCLFTRYPYSGVGSLWGNLPICMQSRHAGLSSSSMVSAQSTVST